MGGKRSGCLGMPSPPFSDCRRSPRYGRLRRAIQFKAGPELTVDADTVLALPADAHRSREARAWDDVTWRHRLFRRLLYAKIGRVQYFAVAVCTFSLVLSHRLDTLGMEREPTWPRAGFAAFVGLGWLLGTTRRVAGIGAPRFLGPLYVALVLAVCIGMRACLGYGRPPTFVVALMLQAPLLLIPPDAWVDDAGRESSGGRKPQ